MVAHLVERLKAYCSDLVLTPSCGPQGFLLLCIVPLSLPVSRHLSFSLSQVERQSYQRV